MDKYYKKLSSFLIQNHNIDKGDRELYEYAVKIIVHGIINIVITILIGLLFGMIKECLCFYITFFILRKFTGGFHAKTYAACLFSSVIIIVMTLFAIKYLEQQHYQVLFIIVVVISTIIIVALAPVENKNKKLSKRERRIYKFVSVGISLTLMFVVILLLDCSPVTVLPIGMGLILTGILLALAVFTKYEIV